MKFVVVDSSQKNLLKIEDLAIKEYVKIAIDEIKGVKLNSSDVFINEKSDNFSLTLDVSFPISLNISEVIKTIQEKVENSIKLVIDKFPENIQIIFSFQEKEKSEHGSISH